MKKGFTLLELIIVIIIVGVLATLGFTQYGRMVERARGAEARSIVGDIRKFAASHRLEWGTIGTPAGVGQTDFTYAKANIGAALDQIPGNTAAQCAAGHYFWYNFASADPVITITATRCAAGTGKVPSYVVVAPALAPTYIVATNLSTGVDTTSGTGGY